MICQFPACCRLSDSSLTFKEFIVVDSLYAAGVHAQGSDLDFLSREKQINTLLMSSLSGGLKTNTPQNNFIQLSPQNIQFANL